MLSRACSFSDKPAPPTTMGLPRAVSYRVSKPLNTGASIPQSWSIKSA